jgi:iron complex outermembrane receptor protein
VSVTTGATFEINKGQKFSANLSSAWRPPHVAELDSNGTHQSVAAIEYGLLLNDSTNAVMNIDEVDFENEQALKLVTSYQQQVGALQFDVTGYANYIFNYIYLKPGGITINLQGALPYFRYTQTDALFLGAVISGTWQATNRLKLGSMVSLLRASDDRNRDYLEFIPSNRYELSFRFEEPARFTLKDFFIETKLKYVDKQRRAPRKIGPEEFQDAQENDTDVFNGDYSNFDFMEAPDAYFLLNVSTGFSVKREKVKYDFRVSADNLLNTSYREYTNRLRYFADDMGRNITLAFKCIF